MAHGIRIDKDILIATLQNVVAQQAVNNVQLEAAVQQQQAEIDRLGMLISKDTEVSEDGSATG